MGNLYKNCKIQDNTAELIYEKGSLFVTIFENNIVHVAQKPGIESVAIEEGFIPKAATPDVTCKDTSDAKGTAAEAGVSDAAVKAVISARDITVNVKDNEKLDIYYKGKLVLSDYEKARKKSEKNPYEDLAIAELEGHTVGKDEEKTDAVTIIKKLGKDDAIYGLGDKPGCLNKRGYSYVNWNTDDPAPHVDSYKNPDSVSNIIVPITNVMNDNYCYQTSKKIRQVFDYKRRNGQYIGAFAPYGYIKHPKDKHRLIVDPDAAENVKLIFTMLIQGSSKRAIALYLNEHGVPSPSAYKVQKGLPVSTRGYDDPMWGVRMIHSILTNPTYTGDLAQGRSRVKSYKVHQIEAVPREEWVEVAGTHEAIIDYETFDKVQALLQRDTRTSPKGREVHLFSGFLKCADCGRAITRCVGKNNNVYYSCSTYKNRSRTACTMHSIKHERLEAAVLFAVQHQVHLAVSYSEIVTQINSAPIKKSQSYRLDDLIAAKERELTKITRYKQSLYQDWKDGEITQQEYRDMKADYERQTSDISAVLTRLNAERAELANGVDNEHPALVAFMKYQNIEALNREILVELVDYIKVYENGNISVKFKFADELHKIAEYIEINTTEDTVVAGYGN